MHLSQEQFYMLMLLMPLSLSHKITCGSWCICGSIWGLRKGNRHTMSPRLRWYSCPLAICRTLPCTTSLRIITAAVSRRVSLRTLSVERRGQPRGWCQRGASESYISEALGLNLERHKHFPRHKYIWKSLFNWIPHQTLIVTVSLWMFQTDALIFLFLTTTI